MIPNLPKKNKLTFSTGSPKDDETVYPFKDAAAIYSLRSVGNHGFSPVVRVRRDSDNSERDFSADDINNGFIKTWTNRQTVKPLDIQELQSDGRTGNFLIANAAYSLRSLGTRQASISSVFPDSFIVSGAGTTAVNGTYVKNGNSQASNQTSLPAYTLFDTDGTTALFSLISEFGGDNFLISGSPSGGGTSLYQGSNDNTDYNLSEADTGSEPAPSVTTTETGKYVVEVRRNSGNDFNQFTADEVTDGTLVDFVLGNTKSLLNSRAYFDGSNDNVGLTNEIDLTGDFSVEYSFVVTEASQQIIGKNASGSYLRAEGSTEITGFRIQTNGSASTVSITSNLKYGEANTIKLKRVSGKFGIYNESDVLISVEFTNSDTFTISSFGKARGSFAKGVIYNIRIDTNNDGTINHSYNGYGNSVSDWTDLVGSNNAAAVNGSPALFTGQDQNGFVKTWYDQSVSNQAGSTANNRHLINNTNTKQPKIVSDGSLLNELVFDGSDDFLRTETNFDAFGANSLALFMVVNPSDLSGNARFLNTRSGTPGVEFILNANPRLYYKDSSNNGTAGANQSASLVADTEILYTNLADRDTDQTVDAFKNGSSVTTSSPPDLTGVGSVNSAELTIGANNSGSNPYNGKTKEIIIYASNQETNRTAIESNIGEQYSISGIPAFDNSVNGFVETWYDQSGNGNDLTQTTATKQPTILSGGVINTRNNKPIIKFIQANSTFLEGSSTIPPSGSNFAFTSFQALHVDASSSARLGVFGSKSSGNNPSNNRYNFGSGTSKKANMRIQDSSGTVTNLSSPSLTDNTNALLTYMVKLDSGNLELQAFNLGSQIGTTQTASITDQIYKHTTDTIVGARASGDNFSDSEFFEVLFYTTDQTSNRVLIETNMNDTYNIF